MPWKNILIEFYWKLIQNRIEAKKEDETRLFVSSSIIYCSSMHFSLDFIMDLVIGNTIHPIYCNFS